MTASDRAQLTAIFGTVDSITERNELTLIDLQASLLEGRRNADLSVIESRTEYDATGIIVDRRARPMPVRSRASGT